MSRGIQLVLKSVGHMGTGIVVHQDDAFSGFTKTFFGDLGTQLSRCLTVVVNT